MSTLILKRVKHLNRHLTKEEMQMVNVNEKMLIITCHQGNMQIETTQYHHTTTRMAKI